MSSQVPLPKKFIIKLTVPNDIIISSPISCISSSVGNCSLISRTALNVLELTI
jgi:hypothetical protein